MNNTTPNNIETKANIIEYIEERNLIKNAPKTKNASAVLQYAKSVLSLARWVLSCAK